MRPGTRFIAIIAVAMPLGASAFKLGSQPSNTAAAKPPLRALIVGGGPDREDNQVAIESNVRYVCRLLPSGSWARVLYAGGNSQSSNVLYQDAEGHDRYRKPKLPRLDGPSRPLAFAAKFQALKSLSGGPVLLYFTGHGGPDKTEEYVNNEYGMWGDSNLSVKDLSHSIDALPAGTPVTLVMVQCYSGAFSNVLFQGGNPQGEPTDKELCGFFASVPSREAAGCTSAVDEADYHDFTSYFFAALSGRNRQGKPVSGADYNHDGKVGMDEAYAYTLIHDQSIDTPVCTSDTFLRRFVEMPSKDIFKTRYVDVMAWAAPAQRAALDSLSRQIGLTGEDRLEKAYARFEALANEESDEDEDKEESSARLIRFVRLSKSVVLAHQLQLSGVAKIKERYASLLAAEAGNPLRP